MSPASAWYPAWRRGCQTPSRATCCCQAASNSAVLHAPWPRLAQARRTAGGASPLALRAGTTAPRVPSNWPVSSIQNTITRPRFVPTGTGSTSAHNRLIRRYTSSCIGGPSL